MIRIILSAFLALLIMANITSCNNNASTIRLLVFSKTNGFRHKNIPDGIKALEKLGRENGYEIVATEDSSLFTEENLKGFSAVVFLNTTGDILNANQQADFERYIQAGGGFAGIHSATDTEYEWPWYNKLVGAYFDSHPKIQEAKLKVSDHNHLSSSMLPEEWVRTDEWYNFKNFNDQVNVTISIDETSYEGGNMGASHPMSWYHEYDGGRAFYTEFGHTSESFEEPLYLQHILGGIQYAIGENKRNYTLASSDRVPLENRFVRTVLAQNLEEPMELEYLPGDKILFIERRGDIKIYDLKSNVLRNIDHFDAAWEKGENGMLGLAVDPDFEKNHWIYIYYSPTEEDTIQRLSRFVLNGESIDRASEKVLLKVPDTRQCCHSGGSVEFGPDGLLYLSVGDNTNPFASDGYSPSDEQEGRFIWDAQKSSANTNDLRGKVLRIKPEEDGTYSIPEGNLFPVGTAGTRPEIYAMGLRNPFRISIDSKTNYLYWGDVGPDAGSNNETRGPKGLDEINQARKPGNWGWPYTRGNNQVYWDYDFDAGKAIGPFDPNNLINNSPNNTGLEKLPPAQPSMIWYGYDKSEEFPWVGTGGKNPMAGPVYHSDQYEGMENRFPDYFEGKLFFYEWIRDWIYIITFDEEHNYKKAERFMPSTRFNNPMDMLFGKDGNLYILEYGEKWTSRNMDARLTKISYVAGNRTPIARITTNKVVGATPLTIEFSAAGSLDLENDDLTYSWTFEGDGPQAETPEATYTFNNPGVYNATLTVKDSEGLSASTNVEIIAGNEPPVVQIDIPFEKYFYSNGEQSVYKVIVKDQEDGSNQDGSIPADNIKVTLAYLPEGQDLVQSTIGHQPDLTPRGLRLINGSDCKACHGEAEKINGPSYRDIAAKYSSVEKDYLINKVLNGGAGVWGETPMAAHPQHNRDEVAEMINYILSLKDEGTRELAMSGTLKFDMHDPENEEGIYILTASYTDRGNGEITALSSQKQLIFRFPALEAENANQMSNGVTRGSSNGRAYLNNLKHGSHFMFEDVIMDGLKNISVDMLFGRNKEFSGTVIIRKGSVDGEELGRKSFQYFHPEEYGQQLIKISIPALSGRENIFFILEGEEGTEKEIGNVNRVVLGY